MPRITRRHRKISRKHVKKSKYTRRKRIGNKRRTRRRRRRGGMPPPSSGWMGPPVEPRDDTQTTMGDLLLKDDAYKPNPSDSKLVNIYDLRQAEGKLNAYFKDKRSAYNNRPVGITIKDMKISNCTSLLRAGNPEEICLNVEYERRMGSIKFTNFRQIGPLEIFKNEETGIYEIPFITMIKLLDLRFDVTRPITEDDSRNPDHILSLLIKDISDEQFERYPRINIGDGRATARAIVDSWNEPAPAPPPAPTPAPAPAPTPAPARPVPRRQAKVTEAFANVFTPPE